MGSITNAEELCRQNGLKYITSDQLYIERLKHGRAFRYKHHDKGFVTNAKQIAYFKSLAIPPIYTNVKLTDCNASHLQAVGHDTNGNQQYFYHEKWEHLRNHFKFKRLPDFARLLPSLRRKLRRIMSECDDDHDYILAGVVRLLDETGLRVGYERSNQTFGLCTLKKSHIDEGEDYIALHYKGKGGQNIERILRSNFATDFIDDCFETPGQKLFRYKRHGEYFDISARNVNNFIKEHLGEEFSAKDFRTWRCCTLFIRFWMGSKDDFPSLKSILTNVSDVTCNTPNVLRTSYIHPALIEKAKDSNFLLSEYNFKKVNGLRKAENIALDLMI